MSWQRAKRCRRGHLYVEHGRRYFHRRIGKWVLHCLRCYQIWSRLRHATRSEGSRQAAETRRARYGPSGMTDKMRASIAAAGRASADRRRTKETCTRGHPFDETNTIQTGRQRVCRACSRVRQREYRTQRRLAEAVRVALVPTRPTRPVPLPRPRWRQLGEACVSIEAHDQFALARWTALRAAMLAAHPDRGGTVRGFERALAAFRTFVKDEDAWYERVLLRPPWTQTRPGPARPDQAQLEAPGAAAPRGDPPRDAGVPARRRPGPSTS